MVRTRTPDYDSSAFTLEDLEDNIDNLNISLGEDDFVVEIEAKEEAHLPFLSVKLPKDWGFSAFDDMEDYGGGTVVRDRYSERTEGIAFNDWKTRFRSWQRT